MKILKGLIKKWNIPDFFKDDKFVLYGKEAELFSENFYWEKVVKKYLKLIN